VRSLAVQGGPFDAAQAADFLARPYAQDAVALRRWDELAKDPEMVTPALEDFRPVLERAERRGT
jgi:gamma-butyrobetaine dioxygenase